MLLDVLVSPIFCGVASTSRPRRRRLFLLLFVGGIFWWREIFGRVNDDSFSFFLKRYSLLDTAYNIQTNTNNCKEHSR